MTVLNNCGSQSAVCRPLSVCKTWPGGWGVDYFCLPNICQKKHWIFV